MALDKYIQRPEEMTAYLTHNSWHFNKKAMEYAVSLMRKHNPNTGKMEEVDPWQKEYIDDMLKRYSIVLENNKGYDVYYVANMARADFWKSSIEDERHLALFIKDVVDDKDQVDGFIFRRWYSDMINSETPIEWSEIL